MNKERIIRRTLLALALTAFGASSMAQVTEQEPNHPLTAANADRLKLSGSSISVRGTVGKLGTVTDVDFFAFDVQANDTVKVDIKSEGFNTWVWLFDPAWKRVSWGFNELAAFPAGAKAGKWVVGISADPTLMFDNGIFRGPASSGGAYTFTLTVESAELHILLDIKPGSASVAPINPKAKGAVPVALLSSKDFNALDVDVSTLTFGRAGTEKSFRRCGKDGEDVNADGLPDLVCHFDNEVAAFQRGDSVGVAKGKTKDGKAFKGTGDLKVVPEKP